MAGLPPVINDATFGSPAYPYNKISAFYDLIRLIAILVPKYLLVLNQTLMLIILLLSA
jgi:hypothetical protein